MTNGISPQKQAEIVRMHLTTGVSVEELSNETGIPPDQIAQWVEDGLRHVEKAFSDNSTSSHFVTRWISRVFGFAWGVMGRVIYALWTALSLDIKVFLAIVVSLLLAVPITLLGFDFFAGEIRAMVASAGVALALVSLLFLTLLCFRDTILRSLRLSVNTSLNDLADPLTKIFTESADRNWKSATENGGILVRRLISRFAWLQSVRTMLGVTGWLFLSFAALAGSAILVEQNTLLKSQNNKFDRQIILLETQEKQIGEQIKLSIDQNRLVDEQNALSEAARRAFTATEVTAIMDAVAEEIRTAHESKESSIQLTEADFFPKMEGNFAPPSQRIKEFLLPGGVPRVIQVQLPKAATDLGSIDGSIMLSKQLYGRIVSLMRILRPYRFHNTAGELIGPLSPERAQVVEFLTTSNIFMAPMDMCIDSTYADFRSRYFGNKIFYQSHLSSADFSGSKMIGVYFVDCDLRNAKFSNSSLMSCYFQHCFMPSPEHFAGATDFEGKSLNLRTTNCYFAEDQWHKLVGLKGTFRYERTVGGRSILCEYPSIQPQSIGVPSGTYMDKQDE